MTHKYEDILKIKKTADNIQHCGDYGQTYIHINDKKIVFVAGDADDIDGDELSGKFAELGYEFEIEYESHPEFAHILISHGTEKVTFYKDEKGNWIDTEELLLPPRLVQKELTPSENATFQIFLSCKERDSSIQEKMQLLMYVLTKNAATYNYKDFLERLDISEKEYETIKQIWKDKLGVEPYC
jgi:hypothetical protein